MGRVGCAAAVQPLLGGRSVLGVLRGTDVFSALRHLRRRINCVQGHWGGRGGGKGGRARGGRGVGRE